MVREKAKSNLDDSIAVVDNLEVNIFDMIEQVNGESLKGALEYANARRNKRDGKEKFGKWFKDKQALIYSQPFFRTLDGIDHVLFVLDFDSEFSTKVESKYSRNLEKLREVKITNLIKILRGWVADHRDINFLWKIGATGIHGIQYVPKLVKREAFLPIVTDLLFPECSVLKWERKTGKTKGEHPHKCKPICDGWHLQEQDQSFDWCKKYKTKHGVMTIKIDLRMFRDEKRLIRWTYSPSFKIPSIITYGTPIKVWNPEKVLNSTRMSEMKVQPYTIPEFQFWDYVSIDDELRLEDLLSNNSDLNVKYKREAVDNTWTRNLTVYDPDDYESVPTQMKRIMNRMTEFISQGSPVIAPCITKHYRNMMDRVGNHHWSRYVICRFFGYFVQVKHGQKVGLEGMGINHIVNWMRFHVNNERDNLPQNRSRLLENFRQVFKGGELPPKNNWCPLCPTMQSSKTYGVCSEDMIKVCGGRDTPLQLFSKLKNIEEVDVGVIPLKDRPSSKKEFFEKIDKMMKDVLKKEQHSVLWKSTRAGVTTSTIVWASKSNKKIILLEPTNRIAEDTFAEALNIAYKKTGKPLIGAVFRKNLDGCLTLKIRRTYLEETKREDPEWGEKELAYDKLMFHTKPTCSECTYKRRHAVFDTSEPLRSADGKIVPIMDSHIEDIANRLGLCSILTLREHLENIDVLVMTYKRLYSLLLSESEEAMEFMETLLDNFDLLIFDEFSHFTNAAYIDVPIMETKKAIKSVTEPPERNIFSRLEAELEILDYWEDTMSIPQENNGSVDLIRGVIRAFIDEYKFILLDMLTNKEFVESKEDRHWIIGDINPDGRLKHPLLHDFQMNNDLSRSHRPSRETLRTNFLACHVFIETLARDLNLRVPMIEKLLVLLKEDEFSLINVPSAFKSVDFRLVAAPKTSEIIRFTKRFARRDGHRVIITDATMPKVNANELFGGVDPLHFEDEIIGDPRGTNKAQLIISDHRTVGLVRLTEGEMCRENCMYRAKDSGGFPLYDEHGIPVCNYGHGLDKIRFTFGGDRFHATRCWRKLAELGMFVKQSVKMFGGNNTIIVLPNKRVAGYFSYARSNKGLWRHLDLGVTPDVELTYFRSDKTVGVRCDRRVMIAVCPPYTPPSSTKWLAQFYWQQGMMRDFTLEELANELRLNEIRQSFWQTIGRAKDPTCQERSVVMCWGIGPTVLNNLLDYHTKYMKDTRPEIFMSNRSITTDSFQLGVASVWREKGVLVPEGYVSVASRIFHLHTRSGLYPQSLLERATGLQEQELRKATLDSVELSSDIKRKFGCELRAKKTINGVKIVAKSFP